MNIREIEDYGYKILTEKVKDGSMTVYAKFSEAEKKNQNSRIYPLEILTREVDRLQSKILSGQFLGQSDHSDSPATFLKDVSHVVTKLEMIGNNGYATIKILNTSAGKNVQEIIKGEGKIGVSTRSVGSVDAKTGIVQKDLRLLALDLVANPSVADATIGKENILEGIDFEENEDKDLEKEIDELERESYLNAVNAGFKGDQRDWLKNCGSLREAMGIPVEKEEAPVQKLTEEQITARTCSYYQEAVAGGFIGSINEWKEKFPQIVEQASKVKVIIEKKEIKAPEKLKFLWNEVLAGGFRGTIDEWKEQHPDMELVMPTPLPQKKIVAEEILSEGELKQEAGRIFTALLKDNPNSSLQLEDVIRMLEKEELAKVDKRIRRKAIQIVSRELDGSLSQEQIEKMVEAEVVALQKERKKRLEANWECYKKLLD